MFDSSRRGDTVSINGMEMYYEIHGQGEPLVLLHGFTGSTTDWQPMLEQLGHDDRWVIPMYLTGKSGVPERKE